MTNKNRKIWVFATSCFGQYYDHRWVRHRCNSLQEAADYYYKKDGNFELPADLCIATLPYILSEREQKLVVHQDISNSPYVLLTKTGFNYSAEEYHVDRFRDKNSLANAIDKYIMQHGKDSASSLVAGISFDLEKMVERISISRKKKVAQDLLSKLGLEGGQN